MAKAWLLRHRPLPDLVAEWNERLKDDGFQDIEEVKGGEYVLKSFAATAVLSSKIRDPDAEDGKLEYFTLLLHAFNAETQFADESDRLIMELTAAGKLIWEISKELRRLGMAKYNRDTIRYVRRRYETKWGLRAWKPFEMTSRKVLTK